MNDYDKGRASVISEICLLTGDIDTYPNTLLGQQQLLGAILILVVREAMEVQGE